MRPDRPAPTVPRELATVTERRLVVELELEDGLPAGRVHDPEGDVHAFQGWLELMSAIAAAAGVDRAQAPR